MHASRKSNRPRRILLAVSSLSAGGAERVISEMANWWAAIGREVGILTLENSGTDHYPLHPSVERIAIDRQVPRTRLHIPLQSVRNQLTLRRAVLAYRPDVVISFIDRTNVTMLCALLGTGIPRIVSERVDPRHYDIGGFWSLARRLLYPTADILVVQTGAVAGWASRVTLKKRLRMIPNFVRALPEPVASAEDSPDPRPAVVAIGRLAEQKGHDVLIRAFARMGAQEKGWRLVILGEGPQRPNLEKLAGSLGIGEAVSLPGIVPEPALWLHKAGLFVLPSRFEGFPNALLEAMACGCAVISADCPSGPSEIIRDDHNGLLVPREDVDALASAMERLMADEALRRRLGRAAREVRSRFSQTAIMALWDDLIARACALQS